MTRRADTRGHVRQAGLSLVEMLISMALGVSIMSGVVSVLLTSKNNFIAERELASLQENARFAVNFLSETIMMGGFNGCHSKPLDVANSIEGAAGSWYLKGTGIEGFDQSQGSAAFPAEFRADVAEHTDALVIRRGESTGLVVNGSHNPSSATLPLNRHHSIKPGQVLILASRDCQQIGIFAVTGPTNNNNNNASHVNHNEGNGGNLSNCTKDLRGTFDCNDQAGSLTQEYPEGSFLLRLRSEAFFVGASAVDPGIPALFREMLVFNSSSNVSSTRAEELVQGVENLQVLYGLDNTGVDGLADIYQPAGTAGLDWSRVVSVRLHLRMRSLYPVYSGVEAYPAFQGVAGTDGADRYMRQLVSTTIRVRNAGTGL